MPADWILTGVYTPHLRTMYRVYIALRRPLQRCLILLLKLLPLLLPVYPHYDTVVHSGVQCMADVLVTLPLSYDTVFTAVYSVWRMPLVTLPLSRFSLAAAPVFL